MSELYSDGYGSRKKQQRSAFGVLADAVMMVVTIPVVLLFVSLLIVPHINPNAVGVFSILGLIAPFVYAVMLALSLYWIVRWRWVAIPVCLLAVIGSFSLSLFYRPELKRYYEKSHPSDAVKVLTYNTRSFINDAGERCLDSVVELIRAVRPDVVCFQEMGFSHKVDSMLEPLKLMPLPKSLSRVELSPAIYSRYPIVGAERIDSMKNFVWADVVIRKDTVRLFNLHLHTTAIRRDEGRYIENHEYLEEEGDMDKLRSMVSRLSENNKLRSTQADTISQIIAKSPYPVIVCGDFNDTPVSYTYRKVSRKLKDAFREVGRGYSHTYRGFFDMLRIDYVLHDKHFKTLGYEVIDSWGWEERVRRQDTILVRKYGNNVGVERNGSRGPFEVEYSDHYPVLVHLEIDGDNI